MEIRSPLGTKRIVTLAVFTSCALVAGFAESRFPLPFPGMRLGLANVFTLSALILYGLPGAASVAALRLGIAFFLSGNAVALSCGAAGAALSLPVEAALLRFFREGLSLRAISVAGAFAFNAGQLLAAVFMTGAARLFAYLPPLWAAGAAAGYAVGLAAEYICEKIIRDGAR
jgi:heptaprenyl diphosphate synthase